MSIYFARSTLYILLCMCMLSEMVLANKYDLFDHNLKYNNIVQSNWKNYINNNSTYHIGNKIDGLIRDNIYINNSSNPIGEIVDQLSIINNKFIIFHYIKFDVYQSILSFSMFLFIYFFLCVWIYILLNKMTKINKNVSSNINKLTSMQFSEDIEKVSYLRDGQNLYGAKMNMACILMNMGNEKGSKSILQEIIQSGNNEFVNEAQEMLNNMPS